KQQQLHQHQPQQQSQQPQSQQPQLQQRQQQQSQQQQPQQLHQQETKPADERGQGVMQYLLPQELIQSKRKLLVMDLDETMVFSTFEEMKNPDFVIDGMSKSGRVKTKVKVRPFLRRFLSECSKKYDIVVFTASGAPYANYVLDKIDVDCVIAHRLFGDSLTKFGDGKYIKVLLIAYIQYYIQLCLYLNNFNN
ncbi:hypothetical protein RFI_21858, partial [Reticulomyxa filosa]